MNLPNKLTLLRIILVPFFAAALLIGSIPHHYLIALLIFAGIHAVWTAAHPPKEREEHHAENA